MPAELSQALNGYVYGHLPGAAPQPADPEAQALQAAEVEAAKEAQDLVHKLQAADSDGTKAELKAKLRPALAKQFEAQQKQRTREIAGIEERLNKLKETLKKRDGAKETIVDRRLDQLTGVTHELAWEETRGVPAGLPRVPVAYPSGFAPQPLGVPALGAPAAGNTVPRPPTPPPAPGTSSATAPPSLSPPALPGPATAPLPSNRAVPALPPASAAPAATSA